MSDVRVRFEQLLVENMLKGGSLQQLMDDMEANDIGLHDARREKELAHEIAFLFPCDDDLRPEQRARKIARLIIGVV